MKALRLILNSKAYFAPAFIFMSLNLCVGTWAVSIPQIKSSISFSEAELGLAILCFGFGTFIMLLFSPKLINLLGLSKSNLVGVCLVCISVVFPFVVTSYLALCIALFAVGISTGFTDIAMNTLVSQIESEQQVNIMSANHGFFSLGGVISSSLGAICILFLGAISITYVLILCILVFLSNIYFYRYYKDVKLQNQSEEKFEFTYIKPLFVILMVGFLCMAAEGAVADWSALYLEIIAGTEKVIWPLGFLSFSIFMTLGRFVGDALSYRLGSYKVLYLGLSISILGFVFVLLKGAISSITGFGLIGLGLSVVIPELFRMSGQYKSIEKSRAISLVAGSGYIGFLIGPVLFGLIADFTSLWWSFLVILVLISCCLGMIRVSKKPTI